VATVEGITDPYVQAFTPPPRAGVGVCDVCHNTPFAGHSRCWSCEQTTAAVTHPLTTMVPISLYEVGSQAHTILASYKRSQDRSVRAQLGLVVAATLHRFLRDHGEHIVDAAQSEWDVMTVVPSKTPTNKPHALELAIQRSPTLRPTYRRLLEPWEPEKIERAKSSDRGYRANASICAGTRVLLVDDTFTSGATFQSAASALAAAGADVVAGVVVGRVINRGFTPEMGAMWAAQRKKRFDFGICCLE
jgi:hypothetical protein